MVLSVSEDQCSLGDVVRQVQYAEVLGPDPTVRLAVVADHEIGHIIQAMLFLYGVDGVRAG